MLPNNARKFVPGVDLIRSIACLWVFLHHLRMYMNDVEWPTCLTNLLDSGGQGVAIFFVLSGFLLSLDFWKYQLKINSSLSIKSYFIRRFARIVPAYFLCFVSLALAYELYQTKWGIIQIFLTLSFTNSFISTMATPSFNTALWSIPVEIYCYLLLALTFYPLIKNKVTRLSMLGYLLVILAASILISYLIFMIAPTVEKIVNQKAFFKAAHLATFNNPIAMFSHFTIGIIFGYLYLINKLNSKILFDLLAILAFILIFIFYILNYRPISLTFIPYDWPLFPLLIGLLILSLANGNYSSKFSELKPFKITATLSYGIYLWHMPALTGIAYYFNLMEIETGFDLLLLGTLSLSLTYFISSLSFYLLEKRIIQFSKKF